MGLAGLKAADHIASWLDPLFNPGARKKRLEARIAKLNRQRDELVRQEDSHENRVAIGRLNKLALKLQSKLDQLG